MQTVVFLCMVAMAMAVQPTGFSFTTKEHHQDSHNKNIQEMVKNEVKKLHRNNPEYTVEICAGICDAFFEMVSQHEESLSDRLCHNQCSSAIHGDHHEHNHHTHPQHDASHNHHGHHDTTQNHHHHSHHDTTHQNHHHHSHHDTTTQKTHHHGRHTTTA